VEYNVQVKDMVNHSATLPIRNIYIHHLENFEYPSLFNLERIGCDGASLNRCTPVINGSPFHQHLFDATPLLEQENSVGPGRGYQGVQFCWKET
jgi:hypothetical protein